MTDPHLPTTVCPLPWLNLSLDVDGSSRPCCKFAHQEAASPYQMANLSDTSLADVWNGDGMQRLRADFRAGVQPNECASCWDEEAAGIRSFRQTYLDDRGITSRPDYESTTPELPVALDLKLSNACNLRCRICGPVASSAWLVEELQRGNPSPGVRVDLTAKRSYYLSNKITADADNRARLVAWAPHLEHVELTGGEPMFSRENRDVIETIVEHGDPAATTLLLTTNATVIDERIFRHLDRFRSVTISLSIDDIGRRLEYERAPSVWSEVEANIARYAALSSPRCQVFTNCTVSIFNVWYLPEYARWIREAYPDLRVMPNVNLVHYPRHYSVQVLPPALKALVSARLADAVADLPTTDFMRHQLDELIAYINENGDVDEGVEWSRGVAAIIDRDRIRGERFADVFPDYFRAIAELGLWGDETVVHHPRRRVRGWLAAKAHR